MVTGRTVLIQKDSAKGTVAGNYRPIPNFFQFPFFRGGSGRVLKF